MMRNILRNLLLIGAVIFATACLENQSTESASHTLNAGFGDYWYQGKAELASYDLEQARYGEIRNGNAVLIFVTEDFSRSKQVKLDYPIKNDSDVLKILKLNATRKFLTGIYPYSTMTSVFTPIYQNDDDKSVKLTTSIQEWCGHTFLQANLDKNKYHVEGHSYFESEGEQNYESPAILMEDEVWNLIRLNPDELPTGTFDLLPGSLYCRFSHKDFKGYRATASLKDMADGEQVYKIQYLELDRTLKIIFERSFPHRILGWEESYPNEGTMMTTRGTLKQVKQLDYWNKNKSDDVELRKALGLK